MSDDYIDEFLDKLREDGYDVDGLSNKEIRKLRETLENDKTPINPEDIEITVVDNIFKDDDVNIVRLDRDLFKILNLRENVTVKIISKTKNNFVLGRVLTDDILRQQLWTIGLSKEFIKKLQIKHGDKVKITRAY